MIPALFSLTDKGATVARRLTDLFPQSPWFHGRDGFKDHVHEAFNQREALIFVTAAGIAVRLIAPLIKDKHTDPAVVIIDECTRFVVPILSGHEGGANVLARYIADALDAHWVVTSTHAYVDTWDTVGLGCEKNIPFDVIWTLWQQTLQENPGIRPRALASIDAKRAEPALLTLSETLQLPLTFFSGPQLAAFDDRLSVKSEVVHGLFGCYGVAEPAALAAAQSKGEWLQLLLPKRKYQGATLAVARAYQRSDGDGDLNT